MRVSAAMARAAHQLRRLLTERFDGRLSRLVLFGSQARGEARAYSDVDALVLVTGLTGKERAEVYELGAEVHVGTRVHIAPLAMSDDEYAELARLERSLPAEIEKDGIAL